MQMSAGMELRPYQKEAVEAIFQEWEKGNKKTLLVQATGTGKTICFSAVAADVAGSGSDVLVLAHRDELLKQASDKGSRAVEDFEMYTIRWSQKSRSADEATGWNMASFKTDLMEER